MKSPAPHGWYRVEDRLIAILGPLALMVVRDGVFWVGKVTTVGNDNGLVLAASGKYRHIEKAQQMAQDLAKEILAKATASLAALKPTVTAVPRA